MGRAQSVSARIPVLLLFLSGFLAPTATANADDVIHVSNLDDGGVGSLRQAIADANSDPDRDEIVFDVTGVITLTSGALEISEDLTVSGPGATNLVVSGAGTSQVLRVTFWEVNARISGVTLENGFSPGNLGGAIMNGGENMTVTDCILRNSTAGQGGGIYNSGPCNLTMTGCQITGNSTQDAIGGGGVYNDGFLTMTDCVVTDNVATEPAPGTGHGGGIYNNSTGEMEMTRCTVSGNQALGTDAASARGGGVYNRGLLEAVDSTIESNVAAQKGGGIYNSSDLAMDGCTVDRNEADLTGGAIYNAENLHMVNCTVSGNSALESGGGVSHCDRTWLTNCTITNNSASGIGANGGGIYSSNQDIQLKNCIVSGNVSFDGPDCHGPATSYGCNIIGDDSGCTLTPAEAGIPPDLIDTDPQLGPLQDNGGPTLTHAIGIGSPAVDAIAEGDCSTIEGETLTTDQRGYIRPFNGDHVGTAGCDIGAYELNDGAATVHLPLEAGWNMVSVPLLLGDSSPDVVFDNPEAVYTWDPLTKSYTIPTSVEPCRGYWVAKSSDETVEVTDAIIERWTQPDICCGWNMIGSVYGTTCPFTNPDDTPDGSVEGFAYWWDPVTKSYQYCNEICPCKGYWAAATCDCELSLN